MFLQRLGLELRKAKDGDFCGTPTGLWDLRCVTQGRSCRSTRGSWGETRLGFRDANKCDGVRYHARLAVSGLLEFFEGTVQFLRSQALIHT